MADERLNDESWRTQAMYTISQAAHLADVHPSTVRRWLYGYVPDSRFPDWRKAPVFKPTDKSPYVSFLQLIELVVAADFRKASRVSLEVVTRAHQNARKMFELEYPFAHINLESLGGHIVQWIGKDTAQSIDEPVSYSLPGLVEQRIGEVEYEHDLAARWYPVGRPIPIVVDPRFGAGVPTIDGRGVTVRTIYKRWKADQPISFIADDLALERDVVERALRYADKIAA